jgi:hypothetical protein
MSAYIDLYIDVQSLPGRLVGGLTGGNPPVLTSLHQGSRLPLRIFPVKPTGLISSGSTYTAISVSDFSAIKIAVGPRAGTGSPYAQAGAGTSYAFTAQTSADADGLSNYFYGELNLNTTELNSAVGTAESIQAYLEVHLAIAGAYRVVYQVPVIIAASVIPVSGSVSLPTAASEYLTRDEIFALFVAWDSSAVTANRGRNIILLSPDGASTRELGVDDAKTPVDNLT